MTVPEYVMREKKNSPDFVPIEGQINLLQETETALKNHGLALQSIKFIRNSVGFVPVADFAMLAYNIYYDNTSEDIVIDPSLKLVGRTWWLERGKVDGVEGWIFYKKPEKPLLQSVETRLYADKRESQVNDWKRMIEQ